MNHSSSIVAYRTVASDGLDAIRPLWVKLREYHSDWARQFEGEARAYEFEPRKRELLAKATARKLRIELVSTLPDGVDVAYCVSTVSADGRGEVDSLFVDAPFRSQGIGSELVRHALVWFESAGATSKAVTVAYGNEEALAFYRRFGFRPRTLLL
jgi:ribosomal protein S18 acetylase RimI-like enzyme